MSVSISEFHGEFRLQAELLLPRGLDEVFPFFAEASNLAELTPSFLQFAIITPQPIEMRQDAVIDYRLRVRKVPISWRSVISVWDPPHLFVDEQLRGPYRYWIHQPSFEARGSETLVRDVVRYQVFGGRLIHKLFVERDVMNIFNYRQTQLIERFS